MSNNSKIANEQIPPIPLGIGIVASIMSLYSVFIIITAILVLSDVKNPSHNLAIFLGIVALVNLVGVARLVSGNPDGSYWGVGFGGLLALTSIGFPTALLIINGIIGISILLYFSFRRDPVIASRIQGDSVGTLWRQGDQNFITEISEEPEMPQEEKNIDILKYELEAKRFLWEKNKYENDNRLLNKHFGLVITSIVSVAAIIISYFQITIASDNAKAQLENEKLRNDRQFYVEVAKFLLDRRQEMTTSEKDKVIYLRSVVISSFPPDVAIQIASRMRDNSATSDIRRVWEEGLAYLRAEPGTSRAR